MLIPSNIEKWSLAKYAAMQQVFQNKAQSYRWIKLIFVDQNIEYRIYILPSIRIWNQKHQSNGLGLHTLV